MIIVLSELYLFAQKNNFSKKIVTILKYFIIYFLKLTLVGFLFLLILIPAYFFHQLSLLPDPTPDKMLGASASSYILDRNGAFLYEYHGDKKRTDIPLNEIPQHLKDATVVIEDKNFYDHFGFEPVAIARAALINFRYGEIRQGASTITQQLARTLLLNNEVTYTRKIKEIMYAIKIEKLYNKDEILTMYLNNIPYGSNAYGIVAASEIYFGKKVQDLSLLESAYLAALPKAPSDYSPFGPNANLLHKRARLVLRTMRENGYINDEQLELALKPGEIKFKRVPVEIKAPHFVFYVLDYLKEIYGEEKLRTGGLTIYTSLDLKLQTEAEKIVSARGSENEKKFNATNAALVSLDPSNGEILAMVGSRDYFKNKDGAVNVTTSLQQPGSSFKPYVYVTGMSNGLTPASILMDTRTNFAASNYGVAYIPQNYNNKNYGPIPVRNALAGSLNVPAVKAITTIGINKVIDTAEKLGITTLKDRQRFGPSLALGGAEVTLLEHTAGLGAIGNNGIKQVVNPIMKIIDKDKELVYERQKEKGTQAVDPQAAYLITDILSDTKARQFIFGRGKNLQITGVQVAVKTGTTQEFRDAWTVGFTPNLATGVWVGNNDNTPMKEKADGSVVAAPIWHDFMEKALTTRPIAKFTKPKGIIELTIDPRTGRPPLENASSTKKEIFASFNAPVRKTKTSLVSKLNTVEAVSKINSEKAIITTKD